jgi:hypothetical protein
LSIAGELQEYEVPAMAAVFPLLDAILSDQPEAMTRYMVAVIFEVLFVTFCVADQSTLSL